MSAALIDAVAIAGLLGGQIIGSAQHVFLMGNRQRGLLIVFVPTGQAHIEHFDHASRIDQQVGRLNIAMHEPCLMGVLQTFGGLADVIGGGIVIERTIRPSRAFANRALRRTP